MFHFRLRSFTRLVISLTLPLVLAAGLVALPGGAKAQDKRQNAPGEFDFYVLSLSWSPSFCEEASERNRGGGGGRSQMQCSGRPYAFVVHGLWPQYENGFPEYCQRPSPRLNRNIVSSMLDLMPAPGLIFNEWDKHGTCSGLDSRNYFEMIRKARAAIKIPAEYLELSQAKTVAPGEVEEAFIKANAGLSNAAISVTCNRTRLSEVRICLSKDLQFRACEEIERRACRRDQVTMPPIRGG
ncbi:MULTISPECIES: ribonuclease T2 [unclassified Bradyrhizobium]|uniref:ribonuclease T2 n=1 Tax=unclassified Bradyrhizobium TaxID=2631580 RepID=UPI001FF89B99|nr:MULTISPECIES: ribonuclease T2 [unclassified Bradyrhizobium]MCK1278931.1 ribonuclease T2 [Bradyrhizobium sp. 61]MCK1448446.1 ribonuclease T2 [Bradyrhizobium sp. 48]MCK1464001.1 ribonuclease T2 [Bradyrhizobium sp. 2]